MSGVIRGSGDHNRQAMTELPSADTNKTLKLFGDAKKDINELFVNLVACISEIAAFMQYMKETNIVNAEQVDQMIKYKEKVIAIKEILERDRMKVVFFGRTSNGKSTVINTMLRKKILPSGLGHTTNCFLQVEGVNESEPYTIREEEPDKKNYGLDEINNTANAVSNEIMNSDTLIRICWPKEKCPILKEDIVLVDSPGTDVDPNLDKWIEKFCLDADVFVMVVNGESTMMCTEKGFFLKVREKLSKPNLFILYNRWDETEKEIESMPKVKKQHMTRSEEFLCQELGVLTPQEVENRVFFVSARETLYMRIHQDQGTPTPSSELREGFLLRSLEFANFEKKFEELISQSAVETKFALHAENGKDIIQATIASMNQLCKDALNKREALDHERRERKQHLEASMKQMDEVDVSIQEKINRMTEEVAIKVSSALTEEIMRLPYLINSFDVPFTSEPTELTQFKKRLNAYVESMLVNRVQGRCSDVLGASVLQTDTEIADQLLSLIPDETRRNSLAIARESKFEMLYRLDCTHLCKDFQEDLEFQFSLGLTGIIKKLAALRQSKTIPRPMSGDENQAPSYFRGPMDDEVIDQLTTLISLTSRTTIGMLVLGGVLIRTMGWKMIAGLGACYGAAYAYQRFTWNMSAKEETFKRQYVDYVTSKLRMIVHLTSTNCSDQVNKALTTNFNNLRQQVDISRSDFEKDLTHIDHEIKSLEEAATKANVLKNKAQFAKTHLNRFVSLYLKSGFSF